ncbi:MAG TPA: TonB-dependent receptor [Rhizomicrobium sp.]|nr:TonB-dependent receptor [Rhizomicrobium sp.]
MPAQRKVRTGRSLTIMGALMLTTALAAPAFAQVEQVVVTAQKKSEDIQNVPIAVSAFSGADLASHQIQGFADLRFNLPSVSFTHGNFGPSNFTIRGIGSAAVTTSGDSGVSVNLNQVYLNAPNLTGATYYDLDPQLSIQVLRGPQSTLWGRNATGGAIDIETAKPDLDNFASDVEATYGNYSDQEVRAMVNLPIDQGKAALRISGFWENRDGTVKNDYPGLSGDHSIDGRVDGRNDYSFRGSFRWQPSSRTTLDVMLQTGHEDDSRVRGQVQVCDRDPSGVLGCLPDKWAFQPTNGNATLGTLLASNLVLGDALSLFDVVGPNAVPGQNAGQFVPHSLRTVNTPFSPFTRGKDLFAMTHWRQNLSDWLDMDLTLGYDNNSGLSQESYNNTPGDSLNSAPNCTQLFLVSGGADVTCTPIPGVTRLVAAQEIFSGVAPTNFNTYYAAHLGTLPVTKVTNPTNTGIANLNDISSYRSDVYGYDQIDGRDKEWSGELRFSSNFSGPFNFNLGFYHNADRNDAHYYVDADTLDYAAVVLGGATVANGAVLYPSQYDNDNNNYQLTSNAAFGELYYWAIPDELKFTVGARYSVDKKTFESGQVLFNSATAIGTQSFNWIVLPESANAVGGCGDSTIPDPVTGTIPNPAGLPCFSNQSTQFKEWTGRAVVDWTPKVDWSDQTNLYLSYSRGVRDGGFNPPPLNPGSFPLTFSPETLDAYELGDKNTFFGGTLQANVTAWYYKYSGFQVSEIIDRTSINQNINSRLYGVEGEIFWAATDKLQFNMNFGYTHSSIEQQLDIDPRNPVGNVTTNTALIKDATTASLCVINNLPGFPDAIAAGLAVASPDGGVTPINGHNIPSGFGSCSAATAAAVDAITIAGVHPYSLVQGNPVDLKGNEMPNTPPWTVSIGAQYTFDVGDGYTLIPRVDYYWTDKQWARIFEDGADAVRAYDVANAQVMLNSPDGMWYARAWVKNIFDKDNVTGEYLTDASSGLFTNLFVGEPRTYGLTLGVHF